MVYVGLRGLTVSLNWPDSACQTSLPGADKHSWGFQCLHLFVFADNHIRWPEEGTGRILRVKHFFHNYFLSRLSFTLSIEPQKCSCFFLPLCILRMACRINSPYETCACSPSCFRYCRIEQVTDGVYSSPTINLIYYSAWIISILRQR